MGRRWQKGYNKFLERSTSYATAYFEHIDSSGSYSQIKAELSRDELRILTTINDQFVELGALSYQFNPDETYRCVIDPEKSNVQVYSDGTLLVSSLAPPTEVELQSLPGLNRLLLLWLPPDTETFSHVRIYRSLEKEQKGELVADNLTGMTFVDNNFSPGTSYFYNLHSVDQNGKEGSKRSQVMYFRLGQKAAYPPLTEMPVAEGKDQPQFSAKSAITIPFVLTSNKTSDVFPSGAEVYAMDPTNNTWVKPDTVEPGEGYFVKGNLDTVSIDGEPLADKPFELSLKRGWNVIGNPFLESVAIDKISITIDKVKVPFLEAVKKG